MDVLIPVCAGLDVHKAFVIACRRRVTDARQVMVETRRFSTMTQDIEALSTWLAEWGCTDVVMESTGVYWHPIYNILDGRFTIWLVNARHVKQVPGRKTDVNDAAWLAQLLQHGLLKASFIPDRLQRDLRDITRYRQNLVEERNRVANRLQKVLEDANLKLSTVATNIQGASAQDILRALLAGERDPKVLANLARGRMRAKRAELEQALTGHLRDHHRFLLTQLLGHLDFLDAEIATLEARAEELLQQHPTFAAAVERLDTVPGINRTVAVLVLAEIGVDMSRFPSAGHLAAWAGLAPGNNQTGGKQRPAPARRGNRYLKRALVQAAKAASRTKGSYLKALYHRLAGRRGKNRAAVAVAHTLLRIVYQLLTKEQTYRDLGETYFDQLDRERASRRLVQRLRALGYSVQLEEAERPPAEPTLAAA